MIVRPVRMADAHAIMDVINPIVRAGGTTAIEDEIDLAGQQALIAAAGARSLFHVAEAGGRLLGFQAVETRDDLPEDVGDIATFVAMDLHRSGVGLALAEITFAAAKAMGWRALNATIRADNAHGLGYYARIGFREVARGPGAPLKSGLVVDRVHKRRVL